MDKKAQVTIFVLLGLVLVIGVLFFAFSRSEDDFLEHLFLGQEQEFELRRHLWTEEVEHLTLDEAEEVLESVILQEQEYQVVFLEQITKQQIYQMLNTGGIISSQSDFVSTPTGPIIVATSNNDIIEPSLDTIEQQLEVEVCNNLDNTIRKSYGNNQEIFNVKNVDCSLIVGEASILVSLITNLEVKAFGEDTIVSNFEYLNINLRELIDIRDDIIKNFDPFQPDNLESFPNMNIKIIDNKAIISFEYNSQENFVNDFKFAYELNGE